MPREWRGFRSRRGRPRPREVVLALLLGGALGLAVPQWHETWIAPPATDPVAERLTETPDPWAPSRESERILSAQEGAPAPVLGGESTPSASAAVRVIDGDTFWYKGEKIRIADIDTPEIHPPRCAREAALGEQAKRRLEALLGAGPFELHPVDRDEDRFGRKLRIVTRGEESLGDTLVAEGLAREWTGRRMPWCA